LSGLFGSRRKVGNTSLQLPVFGMGTAHLGELYAYVEEAEAKSTFDAAWQSGVRYFDTAPWYGRGLAEHRTGAFLRTRQRSEFTITTQALQRLALDTVDALVIHDLDSKYHDEQTIKLHSNALADSGMKALDELKAAGDIKAVGMGINMKEQLADLAQKVDLDFVLVAMPYTLIDQESLHTGMKACLERNVSVIVGAPFASGILATGSAGAAHYDYGPASEQIIDKVRRIEAVCDSHWITLQAAALQFPLAHPAAASIIPGASNAQEVMANVASMDAPIPAQFWSDLKTEQLLDADAPVPAESVVS